MSESISNLFFFCSSANFDLNLQVEEPTKSTERPEIVQPDESDVDSDDTVAGVCGSDTTATESDNIFGSGSGSGGGDASIVSGWSDLSKDGMFDMVKYGAFDDDIAE